VLEVGCWLAAVEVPGPLEPHPARIAVAAAAAMAPVRRRRRLPAGFLVVVGMRTV